MSLFISNAYANSDAQSQGDPMGFAFMMLILAVVFYFFIYRPQAKRVKEHKNLMAELAKGDEVLTAGGLVGKIAKVSDDKDFVVVALNDQTDVTVQKGSISAVLPKGTMKAL